MKTRKIKKNRTVKISIADFIKGLEENHKKKGGEINVPKTPFRVTQES
jgi:hypothetical protein